MDRRRFLVAALLPGAVPSRLAYGPVPGAVDVRRLGARGDGRQDDSPAFQRAIDSHGNVWVPPGRYLVGDLAVWSHTSLRGAGRRSVLVHRPGSALLASVQPPAYGSADPRDNVRDVQIADLAFQGRCESEGFEQHHHLLLVSGASRLKVERCLFRAFQGDGIFIGSDYGGNGERHNEDLLVRDCEFDGVNFANRQGISILDATRLVIERNVFRACSRRDMPGAIDIEPDAPWHVVRDVRILRNRFVDVQGEVGAICVILAINRYDNPPRGIEIRGNRIEGNYRTAGIVAKAFVDGAHAPPIDLHVVDNDIVETLRGFEFSGLRGVRFVDNRLRGTTASPELSVPRRGRSADVKIAGNLFEKVGIHAATALKVYPTADLEISDNRFVDCAGSGPGGTGVIDHTEQPPGEMRMARNVVTDRGDRPVK